MCIIQFIFRNVARRSRAVEAILSSLSLAVDSLLLPLLVHVMGIESDVTEGKLYLRNYVEEKEIVQYVKYALRFGW